LADRAFDIIEHGNWILARREVLRAALTNVGEAPSSTPVDDRLASWAPRRQKYLFDLFEALSGWKRAPDLRELLLGGIHDEERANQRSAAVALGRSYAGDEGVQQRLMCTLRSTLDLSVAAATLEALTSGWPETPGLHELHDSAVTSRDPRLRLAGISGRLQTGRADLRDRDGVVDLLSESPKIDFWDQPVARMLLSRYWPDDVTLIDIALGSVSEGVSGRRVLEREAAMHYLIHCSSRISMVVDWVRQELMDEYPFSLSFGDDDLWACVAPFAIEHSDVRASVLAHIRSEFGRHSLHLFQSLIVKLGGDELRDELIGVARVEDRFSVYWAVRPLLEGWGRSDPIVASFIDEIASWKEEKLNNLAAILPQILTDINTCRTRLLSLARSEQPRFDLIATGLASLRCSAEDTEVVDTLLSAVGKGAPLFDPGVELLTHFPANPRVRQYALQTLSDRAPPLAALARAYENDGEIRAQILAYAKPLPTTLRGDIVDAAATEPNRRLTFQRVLEGYDIEVDGELKIAASIHYHRYIAGISNRLTADHVDKLVEALHAVGPDLDVRRAAALAGMLVLGHVNEIVPMVEYGDKPMNIRSGGGYGKESESLMALMCERWEDMRQAFGAELAKRFRTFGADDGHMWDCLAPHINASPAARRDFLAFCSETDTNLGLRSVITLAREQPASNVLLDHCWRVFGREVTGRHQRHSPWAVHRVQLEIAYILRDHFRDRAEVKEHLREAVERAQSPEIVALVLVEPNDPRLDQLRYRLREIGQRFSDWVTALHLASARSGAEEFAELTLAMINRNRHGIWNFQEITNRAVVERLQRDSETVHRLKNKLSSNPTESETASLPRYLMAAGAFDDDVHERCRSLLQDEAHHGILRAGYDAVDDSIRAVSLSLLEVLAPSLSP
jgi:hypothetical protein